MNHYQFHISDWVLHTSHLSLEEEAVYRRMLDFYYETEAPIPLETQPVIRRLRLVSQSDTFGLILDEFFIQKADGWHNLRADSELRKYKRKADIARENGKKGGRPKKQHQEKQQATKNVDEEKTQPVILANPEKTGSKANHKPITINQEPDIRNTSDFADAKSVARNGVPFAKIVDLYHETLPELPRVEKLTDQRKGYIRQRWNQDLKELDHWRNYFLFVKKSDFLMGKTESTNGKPPFMATLEWLTRPGNYAKVAEEKYHGKV